MLKILFLQYINEKMSNIQLVEIKNLTNQNYHTFISINWLSSNFTQRKK